MAMSMLLSLLSVNVRAQPVIIMLETCQQIFSCCNMHMHAAIFHMNMHAAVLMPMHAIYL
jgi:hypothetical protein